MMRRIALVAALSLSACLPARLTDEQIDDKIEEVKVAGDCIAISVCIDGCEGDSACKSACQSAATPEALQANLALESCRKDCADALAQVSGHACAKDKGSGECKRACHLGSCRPEFLTCADNGDAGGESCLSGSACLDDCEAGTANSLTCGSACFRALSEDDQKALMAQTTCVYAAYYQTGGMNERQATKKVVTTCAGELASCYSGGASGVSTCAQGLACSDLCTGKSDPDACLGQCAANLNQGAQAEFVSFLWCLSAMPEQGEFYESCGWALIDCANPTPGGSTCEQGVGSFQTCMKDKSDTLQCLTTTLGAMRPAQAQAFLDFNVCQSSRCGSQCKPGGVQAVCAACMKTKCKAEFEDCGFK